MSSSIFNFDGLRRAASLPGRIKRDWAIIVLTGAGILWAGHHLLGGPPVRENPITLAVQTMGEQTRQLNLGTSHFYHGLDPQQFGAPAVNLVGPAMNYACLESVLNTHLQRMPNLEYAVIEFDVVPMLGDTLEDMQRDYRNLYDLEIEANDLDVNVLQKTDFMLQRWLRRGWPSAYFASHKLSPHDIVWFDRRIGQPAEEIVPHRQPGFWPKQSVMSRINDGEKRIQAHQKNLTPKRKRSNFTALLRIIDRLQQRNVHIVLVSPPHHESYWRHMPDDWTADLDEAMTMIRQRFSQQALPWWDYRYWRSANTHLFYDGDHLNTDGAQLFTQTIDRRIANWRQPAAAQKPTFSRVEESGASGPG